MYYFGLTVVALASVLLLSADFFVPGNRPSRDDAVSASNRLDNENASNYEASPVIVARETDLTAEAEHHEIDRGETGSNSANDPAKDITVTADAEEVAVSYVPSSASIEEADPELTRLSLIDLKSTVQQELLRLGCYTAEVDGMWGPKSRAAVETFNQRTGGRWENKATPKLIGVLRSAPDGFCR